MMMPNPRKLMIFLLSLAILVLPLRVAWAMPDMANTATDHCEASMAMDTDSAIAAESMRCCSDETCVQMACDHCSAFSPFALAFDDYVQTPVARFVQLPGYNIHTKSQLVPPFRPPRA